MCLQLSSEIDTPWNWMTLSQLGKRARDRKILHSWFQSYDLFSQTVINMIQTSLPNQSKWTQTVLDWVLCWRRLQEPASALRQFNLTQHLIVSNGYSVETSKLLLTSWLPQCNINWERAIFDNLSPVWGGWQTRTSLVHQNVCQAFRLGAFRAQSNLMTYCRQMV